MIAQAMTKLADQVDRHHRIVCTIVQDDGQRYTLQGTLCRHVRQDDVIFFMLRNLEIDS